MAKSYATKFAYKPGAKPDDPSLTAAEFETAVFMDAVGFSATVRTGPGKFHTEEFTDLQKAVSFVETAPLVHSRGWILHAFNEAGRRTVLDRDNWPEFLKLWNSGEHPLNRKQEKI